jgi:hypothetical protein
MSPSADLKKVATNAGNDGIPTTNEIGVFFPRLGAKYFSLIKPQSYSVRMMDEIIRDFLELETLGLSFDFECDKWRWRCCRTLHFVHVEFQVSLFHDLMNEKFLIKFVRVAGCAKIFSSVIDDFCSYLKRKKMDAIVKQVCPITLAESPICLALSMDNKKVHINSQPFTPCCSRKSKIVNASEKLGQPMPMTASQLVKSCSSLIQWSQNDVNEALPAILSSIPRIWADYAYHCNLAEKEKTLSCTHQQSGLDEISVMESSLRKLYATLCAIVIQSSNLISTFTNHHTVAATRQNHALSTSIPASVNQTAVDTPSPVLTAIRRNISSGGFSSIITNSSIFTEPLWSSSSPTSTSTLASAASAKDTHQSSPTAFNLSTYPTSPAHGNCEYDYSWIDCEQDDDEATMRYFNDTAMFKMDSALSCRSIPFESAPHIPMVIRHSSSVESSITRTGSSDKYKQQVQYDDTTATMASIGLGRPTLSRLDARKSHPCHLQDVESDRSDATRAFDFSLQHLCTEDLFTCLFLALGCIFHRLPFKSASTTPTPTSNLNPTGGSEKSTNEKSANEKREPRSLPVVSPTLAHAPMDRGEGPLTKAPLPTTQPTHTRTTRDSPSEAIPSEAVNVEAFIHELLTTNSEFVEVMRDLPALAIATTMEKWPPSLTTYLSPCVSATALSFATATATAATTTATTATATATATAIGPAVCDSGSADSIFLHPISTKAVAAVGGLTEGAEGEGACDNGGHCDQPWKEELFKAASASASGSASGSTSGSDSAKVGTYSECQGYALPMCVPKSLAPFLCARGSSLGGSREQQEQGDRYRDYGHNYEHEHDCLAQSQEQGGEHHRGDHMDECVSLVGHFW